MDLNPIRPSKHFIASSLHNYRQRFVPCCFPTDFSDGDGSIDGGNSAVNPPQSARSIATTVRHQVGRYVPGEQVEKEEERKKVPSRGGGDT
jgi:hypothetical protein